MNVWRRDSREIAAASAAFAATRPTSPRRPRRSPRPARRASWKLASPRRRWASRRRPSTRATRRCRPATRRARRNATAKRSSRSPRSYRRSRTARPRGSRSATRTAPSWTAPRRSTSLNGTRAARSARPGPCRPPGPRSGARGCCGRWRAARAVGLSPSTGRSRNARAPRNIRVARPRRRRDLVSTECPRRRAAAASPRPGLRGISASRGRGVAATWSPRNVHVAAVAATRLRGIYTSRPRRRRDLVSTTLSRLASSSSVPGPAGRSPAQARAARRRVRAARALDGGGCGLRDGCGDPRGNRRPRISPEFGQDVRERARCILKTFATFVLPHRSRSRRTTRSSRRTSSGSAARPPRPSRPAAGTRWRRSWTNIYDFILRGVFARVPEVETRGRPGDSLGRSKNPSAVPLLSKGLLLI